MSGKYSSRGSFSSEASAGNYPPEDDSTSSGGYGSPPNVDVWSSAVQRGSQVKPYYAKTEHIQGFNADEQDQIYDDSLIVRSLTGSKLSDEVLAEERAMEVSNYVGDSFETAKEARDMLAATSKSPPRK